MTYYKYYIVRTVVTTVPGSLINTVRSTIGGCDATVLVQVVVARCTRYPRTV